MSKSISTSKWQAGRQQFRYVPAMWFWFRFCQVALFEAMRKRPDGAPSDEALLARWWFAYSVPAPERDGKREFVSFGECCHWLGFDELRTDAERLAFLEHIDKHSDFDNEECDARLEILLVEGFEGKDDEELFELPEMFRVVPAVDQLSLLDLVIASMNTTAAA